MKKFDRLPDEICKQPITKELTTIGACSQKYESILVGYYWDHILSTRHREWKPNVWFYCAEWMDWTPDDAWLLRDALYHRKHRDKTCKGLTFLFVDMEGLCWSWREAPLPY